MPRLNRQPGHLETTSLDTTDDHSTIQLEEEDLIYPGDPRWIDDEEETIPNGCTRPYGLEELLGADPFPSHFEGVMHKILSDGEMLDAHVKKKDTFYYFDFSQVADEALSLNAHQRGKDFVRRYLSEVVAIVKQVGFKGVLIHIDIPKETDDMQFETTLVSQKKSDGIETVLSDENNGDNLTQFLEELFRNRQNRFLRPMFEKRPSREELVTRFRVLVRKATQEDFPEEGDREAVVVGEELGQGGIGVVFNGEGKTGKRAIKFRKLPVSSDVIQFDYFEGFKEVTQACPELLSYHGTIGVTPWDSKPGSRGKVDLFDLLPEGTSTVRDRVNENSGLDLHWYLETVFKPLLQAVKALHEKGFVHRDLKPDNVFIGEKVLLGDYDLACKSGFRPNLITGSVPYMSPEQFRCSALTPKSDIYGLGKMLYRLFDQEHHEDNDISEWFQIMSKAEKGMSADHLGLPPETTEIINSCLEVNPGDRPSVETLETWIDDLLDSSEGRTLKGVRLGAEQHIMTKVTVDYRRTTDFAVNKRTIKTWVLAAVGAVLMSGAVGFECGRQVSDDSIFSMEREKSKTSVKK